MFLVGVGAACGGTGDERGVTAAPEAVTTTVAPTTVPPTTVPTTTIAPTTTAAPTTEAPTTTLAPTTTVEEEDPVLGTPAAPPPPRANEPVLEVGTLEIPAIGVDKTMYEGITLNTLDRGPGHWPGTAGPGQAGNMVIAGHRTSHDRPFYDLDKLAPGDEIEVTNMAGTFVYQVTDTIVVSPSDTWIVDQTPEKTITLFACHPKGSTRQRIVVRGTFKEQRPL